MATHRIRLSAATAAVTNRFVTSVNMANGAYTLAATTQPTEGARKIVATITGVTGNDTPGTITIVGTDALGGSLTEVLTLVAGGTATSTRAFLTVASITQAGWVINGGNDTIVIGCGANPFAYDGIGVLEKILVLATAANTITVQDGAGGTIAVFKASIVEGDYPFDLQTTGLQLSLAGASDITVLYKPF